jgi:hypothetical protein
MLVFTVADTGVKESAPVVTHVCQPVSVVLEESAHEDQVHPV